MTTGGTSGWELMRRVEALEASENERMRIAHRQIQATVDRLGAENERLRQALQKIVDYDGDAYRVARHALKQSTPSADKDGSTS